MSPRLMGPLGEQPYAVGRPNAANKFICCVTQYDCGVSRLYGVVAATALCDRVNVFGFGGPLIGQELHYDRKMNLAENAMCKNATTGDVEARKYESFRCTEDHASGVGFAVITNHLYSGTTWHDYRCEREVLSDMRKLGVVTLW